ncbi:MAG: ABC transporter substrate-binding protein [Erysipelotrichaceae bacterium]|jgi:peptide/nickel transport system substrate-binding protein|nr:ABC transporter substrate-binding protein [Erysipelotrichaceae bacterium]
MKNLTKLGLGILILAIFLTGCQQPQKTVDTEFTFITVTGGDPVNFNPDARSDDMAYGANQNIFNRLVKLGPKDNVLPDLAKSWEFSEDGTVLTFHLQEGVKWHDGEPFSSADVKWTYDTLIAENWQMSSQFASVVSIEAPDDNTIVMNLAYADATIIAKLSWYATFIMPKHIYEGTDYDTNPANENPIGTGPFKFVSWEKGVAITLERNDDFWGDKPYIKTLIYQIIPDEETRYQAFINGEVDYIGSIPTAHLDDLDGDPNYRFEYALGINRTYITFNMYTDENGNPKSALGSDLAFRMAVAYAVDQDSIFARVGGAGAKCETFISPVFVDFVTEDFKMPATDIDKAMEILEAAGYTKNADGYYVEVTLDFFDSGNWKDLAEIIRANLDKAGIKVTLNMMDINAWMTKVMEDDDFEMTFLAGYQGPDVSGVSGRVQSTGATNIAGYNNPEIDKYLDAGTATSDPEARAAAYYEVQRIMSEDMPMVFLIDNGYKYALKNEFTGFPIEVADKAAASEWTYLQKAQ